MVLKAAKIREWVAMGICASTAALACYIFSLAVPGEPVLFSLALIWTGLGAWLSGQWRWIWGKNWRQLRAGLASGQMPRLTPAARVISAGGLAFSVAYLTSLAGGLR